jgi:hypothetical protein
MLRHQLPSLPDLDAFWAALPEFFAWLAGGQAPIVPAAYRGGSGERIIRDRVLSLPVSTERQSYIEVIRFAAANRLLVDIRYRDAEGNRSTRTVEPYSLAETTAGDILLHTHDRTRNAHGSLRIDRIEGATVTNQSFVPRYAIELSPQGPVRVTPAPYKEQPRLSRPITALPRATQRRATTGGLTYVFQCPVCQKKFNRKTNDPKLNAHKNDWGGQCSGRRGYLVTTR